MTAITPAIRPAIGPAIRSAFDGGAPSLLSQARALVRKYGGALYNPSNLASLFQDSAGTIPVTAPGQPVGLMLDLSGNGHHVSQTTTTARPLYQIIGGFPCVVGDGVDDFLRTPVQIPAGPDRSTTLSVAVRLLSETVDYRFAAAGYNASPQRLLGLQRITVATNTWSGAANYGLGISPAAVGPWPPGFTNTLVLVNQPDMPRGELFINGISRAVRTTSQGASLNGPMTLVLGARWDTSNTSNSAIFASVYAPVALTPAERLTITSWLASVSGAPV